MKPPKIEDAPGLVWRKTKTAWIARWQARHDLRKRGYPTKTQRLWFGTEPSEFDVQYVQAECHRLQRDMLIWAAGGIPEHLQFDGTVDSLIENYQLDRNSPYRKLRWSTRNYYDVLLRRVKAHFGDRLVGDISTRDVLDWHETYIADGKIPMGHSCMSMLRMILSFGGSLLEDEACERLRNRLRDQKFPMGKPRSATLTAENAIAIRMKAHATGKRSIALAQAFQFDLMLRQKDVIGEWVPISEPGISDTIRGNSKWVRGIRWEEIDSNLIIKHVTSKRQKELRVELTLAQMVMEELDIAFPGWNGDRSKLPANGPIVVSEEQEAPWVQREFARQWRFIATAIGIPADVRNMDSRAGAITEATEAGAPLESIKHAATHSDITMTQRYAREGDAKAADVLKRRVDYRNKRGS